MSELDLDELRYSVRKILENGTAEEQTGWKQLVDLGWLLIAVPEELGGLGQGPTAVAVLHGEFGRALARPPFLAAMLAVEALVRSTLADRQQRLERLVAGDLITVSLAGSTVDIVDSRATGILRGVPSADHAGDVILFSSDGDAAYLVPVRSAGLECMWRPTWDGSRRLFDVHLDGVDLAAAPVLARGPDARAIMAALAMERDLALAADSIGGAALLLEMTVEYLKTRRQYGRPLALFQALNHRCADLKCKIAMAEALLADSLKARAFAPPGVCPETMAKAAKYLACHVYAEVAEEAVQLHGGIGVTAEHLVHHFMKRAFLNAQLGGSGDAYARAVGEDLLGA